MVVMFQLTVYAAAFESLHISCLIVNASIQQITS